MGKYRDRRGCDSKQKITNLLAVPPRTNTPVCSPPSSTPPRAPVQGNMDVALALVLSSWWW